jgi:GNAT superfamily N-acetyltransferase
MVPVARGEGTGFAGDALIHGTSRDVGSALMDGAMKEMRDAGMAIAMVGTGDDPGHAPSRATYESAGFERWPVGRYFQNL